MIRLEVIDSTNAEAGRLAACGAAHGTVVRAERQTAGRGRRGRTWQSEQVGNLYFSLLLRPQMPVEKASMLTLVMAQAVTEAMEKVCGVNPGIKWPNDIVMDGKKVVGILTELDMTPGGAYSVIVGVGVNVVRWDFEPELAQKATSLEEVMAERFPLDNLREILLAAILKGFEYRYQQFLQEGSLRGMREDYHARLVNWNQKVRVLEPGGEYEGLALGIEETGELLVAPCGENGEPDRTRIQKVYAGEVSVRGIYGYV